MFILCMCTTTTIFSLQERHAMHLRFELCTTLFSALRPCGSDLERSPRQCSALRCDGSLYAQTCKASSYQTSWKVQKRLDPSLAIRVSS
jgi:hypothetical protein